MRSRANAASGSSTSGYYAVFLHDPDGIKLEILSRPREQDLARQVAQQAARLEQLETGKAR